MQGVIGGVRLLNKIRGCEIHRSYDLVIASWSIWVFISLRNLQIDCAIIMVQKFPWFTSFNWLIRTSVWIMIGNLNPRNGSWILEDSSGTVIIPASVTIAKWLTILFLSRMLSLMCLYRFVNYSSTQLLSEFLKIDWSTSDTTVIIFCVRYIEQWRTQLSKTQLSRTHPDKGVGPFIYIFLILSVNRSVHPVNTFQVPLRSSVFINSNSAVFVS